MEWSLVGGYSSSMRAAVRTSYGPPDVVRIVEVDKPAVRDNEVLVKVHATTVNRTDCGFRAGRPFFVRLLTGLPRPRVTVLGTEFAGEVQAVGAGITSFRVGDRVFGFKGLPFGAHAEYMRIPERDVWLPVAPTCSMNSPVRTEWTRIADARTGHRTWTPGTGHWTSDTGRADTGHRTRGRADAGRVPDAEHWTGGRWTCGRGQGDQGAVGVRTSWYHDTAGQRTVLLWRRRHTRRSATMTARR
jgi:Alcohol dehydrogenase GroES-like domain